ncbi:MAG: FAD:protein FMN transferase [Ruminiclostridium sp.]|nr:FAD:protein FMN transferase [Ruminiclostridium sp.]
MKRTFFAAVLLAAVLILGSCESTAPESSGKDLFAMDTVISLKAYGGNGEKAVNAAADRLNELEGIFSVTRADSDIARINSLGTAKVSYDTEKVITKALGVCESTRGALDITLYPVMLAWGFTTGSEHVPTDSELSEALGKTDFRRVTINGGTVSVPEGYKLDLGSCVKGYAGDELAAVMSANGVTSAIISLGGNVRALGAKPDGSDWKVGVADPFSPNELLGKVCVRDKSVVTSGGYQRYFIDENGVRRIHIIDPSTGFPAESGLASVTVIGNDGLLCDALSTALFVMGKDAAISYWRENGGFALLLVTDDGVIYATENAGFENTSPYGTETIYE